MTCAYSRQPLHVGTRTQNKEDSYTLVCRWPLSLSLSLLSLSLSLSLCLSVHSLGASQSSVPVTTNAYRKHTDTHTHSIIEHMHTNKPLSD
jgi:hypothetical protein